MGNIETKVRIAYEKKPGTKAYNQDKVSEIDNARIKAAHSGNALEYAVYCSAIGVEPEEQFEELYVKGLREYEIKKNTEKVKDLEYHIEKSLHGNQNFIPEKKIHKPKALTELQLKFLKEAELYDRNPFNQLEGKTNLLRKYHTIFDPGNKKDIFKIINSNPEDISKIGRLFNHMRDNYIKRQEYHLKQLENY